jgi:hypothetical protein
MSDQQQTTTDTGAQPAWYEGATNPDLKGWIASKGFADPMAAAESAWNLEKLIGHDKAGRTLVLPKDAADAEGWKAINAKLGVPADASGYQIPDALKDDPLMQHVAATALKANIPASALNTLLTEIAPIAAEHAAKVEAEAVAASKAEVEKLKAEWGGEFDQKSEFARRFLRQSGITDEQMAGIESAIGTTAMLKAFHAWGAKTGESEFVDSQRGGGMSGDRSAVQRQIGELRTKRMAGAVGDSEFNTERTSVRTMWRWFERTTTQ